MGFLEKIFGKKENAESNGKTFDICKVDNFLKNKYDENFQPFKEQVKTVYEELQTALKNFKDSLSNLEKANPTETIDTASLNMALSQRKSFINKMKIMINRLNKQLDFNLDSIVDYQNSSLHSVTETNDSTVKEFSLFEQVFEEQSKVAYENFKAVYNATKKFNNLVSEKRNSIDTVINVQNELTSLKKSIDGVQENKMEIDNYNKKLSNLQEKIKSEEDKLKKLESSDEWTKYNHLIQKKKELEDRINEIKDDISQNFSKIEKPLKKFQHLVQRGIEKIDDGKTLNKYLESPIDALIETKDFTFVNSILEKVKQSINSDKIDLKDKDKTLSEISWLIDHEIFEELIEEYNSLKVEVKKLENDMAQQDILKFKNNIEKNIEQLNREFQTTMEEIEQIKKQIEKQNISIQENKNNLEKKLSSLSDTKIIITLD